eukprot:Skav229978  [mRNA]  locus=scaffold372:377191:382604:+ [translate_table: standard]
MQALVRRGEALGLTQEEVDQALALNRPATELAWVASPDLAGRAPQVAREVLETGRVLEYECYDDAFRPQGRAVVTLREWEEADRGLFLGTHGPSSDGYKYFVDSQMGKDGGLYHICEGPASKCKVRKRRGDNRVLIHIDKWRMLTPAVMLEIPYLKAMGEQLGLQVLGEAARDKKQVAPRAPETGLDAAVQAAAAAAPRGEDVDPEKEKKKRDRSRTPPTGREDFGEFLEKQASRQRARQRQKKKKETKKHREGGAKKKKSKGHRAEASSGSSVESSSSDFQLAPVRGGQEIWRLAQKKPGHLTQKALGEMTRYLANRTEEEQTEERWKGQRVMAYLNQITFATHPPSQVGLRTSREMTTIAVTLDHILSGRLRMEDGEALGTDPPTSGQSRAGRRNRDGRSQRDEGVEAEGVLGERRKEQIGGRQRVSRRAEEIRESSEREPKRIPPSEEAGGGKQSQDEGQSEGGKLRRGQDRKGSVGGPREEKSRSPPSQSATRTVHYGWRSGDERRHKREAVVAEKATQGERKRKGAFPEPEAKRGGSPGRRREEESGDEVTPGKVKDLVEWLRDNDGQHLTAAQVSQHIIIQAITLNGGFGQLLEMSLRPTRGSGGRVRNLMPLPLWPDSRTAIEEVVQSMRYRDRPGEWRSRGETKSRANKALRVEGLLRWHGLVVIGLNYLHAGGSIEAGRAPPGGMATVAQEKALLRIWEMVKIFVDEKEPKKGVPRTPSGDWSQELEKLKISYGGEVTEKARPLTLEQILPGLPSVEHGGLVDLLEVVDEKMQKKLLHPEHMVREDIPEEIPRPQVMCGDDEWEKIVKALYERKLVEPIEQHPVVQGEKVLNGAFGVVKPDRFTDSGEPILRMIFDLRASNTILDQLEGDVRTLSGAAGFQKLLIEEGNQVLVSGDDLTAAFYLFRLPKGWAQYMALRKPVKKSLFKEGAEGTTMVGVCVLPMGWNSAVAIMQHAHRQLALRSELRHGAALWSRAEIRRDSVFPDLDESPAWTIYLDDTTVLEKVADEVAQEIAAQPAEEQERMRAVYAWWGIPTNKAKTLERVRSCERLGAVLDGEKGVLRASTKRSLDLIGLGGFIRSDRKATKKTLQIYAGKAVHILQFRRPLFSVLDHLFKTITRGQERPVLSTGTCNEMILLESLLPVAQCNLRARLDPVVTASDACETGGGACFASRLSRLGEEELRKLMEEEEPANHEISDQFHEEEQKVLVVDLFAGLGGLQRSLELAGVKPVFKVAVEKDKACRRCLRKQFPGLELVSDIRSVDPKMIRGWLKKCPEVDGIICGGGSPCQGLSQLSVDRQHLDDPRSALFFDMAKVMQMVEAEARREGLWIIKFCENVVPDGADIRMMSSELDMRPVLVDAQALSRVRRPRLFWFSVPLIMHEEVERYEETDYDVMVYGTQTEEMKYILDEGWKWPKGESDPKARFPTFTRAIPRAKPPKKPAGLEHTPAEAQERWRLHSFRFPPYTYKEEFVVQHESGQKRVLNANERELLMGFARGHTLSLTKKIPESLEEERELEDLRLAALGNSFHCLVFACVLDHILWSFGVKSLKGHHLIAAEAEQERQDSFAKARAFPEADALSDQSAMDVQLPDQEGLSEAEAFAMEEMQPRMQLSDLTKMKEVTKADLRLCTVMVNAFMRRQEYRGSDVRLDVGTLYRPNCCARATVNAHRWLWHEIHHYRFEREEHINVLELRAYLHTLEWRLRNAGFGDARALHLCDSQVVIAVCTKGRSSSRQLNRLLQKLGAMTIAGGVYPILAWIESHLNPADGPSRYYER